MKPKPIALIIVVVMLSLACNAGRAVTPTPDAEATLGAKVALALTQTEQAQPADTATAVPTEPVIIAPISTSTPVPTLEPSATATTVPTPTETQPAIAVETLDNGWSRHTNVEVGFSIAIPPKWTALDLSADDLENALETASDNNPQYGTMFSSSYVQNMISSGMKFMAVDTSVNSLSNTVPTNMNLLITEMPMDIPLDEYVDISIQQLKNIYGADTQIAKESVDLNGLAAVKITYETTMNDPYGNPQNIAATQYLMLVDDTQCVLTFVSVASQADAIRSTISEIADSFSYKP